jgi:hypothetical protein
MAPGQEEEGGLVVASQQAGASTALEIAATNGLGSVAAAEAPQEASPLDANRLRTVLRELLGAMGEGVPVAAADPRTQGDPWQQRTARPPGMESSTWASSNWQAQGDNDGTQQQWSGEQWWQKEWSGSSWWKNTDPAPIWEGWPRFRQWRDRLRRWAQNTSFPSNLWWDKIVAGFQGTLKEQLEVIPTQERFDKQVIEAILSHLGRSLGEREGDEVRRVARQVLYEVKKREGESLRQFVWRRREQFREAEAHKVGVSPALQAIMLEEGSGLSGQSAENLVTMTSGRFDDVDAVASALQRLDTGRSEHLLGPTGAKKNYFEETSSTSTAPPPEYWRQEGQDSSSDEEPLKDLTDLRPEEEALFLASVEQSAPYEDELPKVESIFYQSRVSTWKAQKEMKQAIKSDRGFYERTRPERTGGNGFQGRPSKPSFQGKRRRPPDAQLIMRSRCARCGQIGHWASKTVENDQVIARECKNAPDTRGSSGKVPPPAREPIGRESQMFSYQMFNYAATATDVAESEVRRLEEVSRALEGSMGSNFSVFFATGGYSLVDPGAAMEVCGERTFQEERRLLKELGLQPV